MPPRLAACIFVAFILWALRRYSKKVAPLTPALWVPLIWVLINASRPLAYWFVNGTAAAEALDPSEGSFVDRNAYLCLIVIGVIILFRRRIDWHRVFVESRWLWILYAYFLISVLWSPDIFISFKRWVKDAGDLVMILIILTEEDPVEAIRGIFIRSAYILIPLSFLFIKYYPDIGRYYNHWTWIVAYCGVTLGKNELGLLAMLSGLFLLWRVTDTYRFRGVGAYLRNLWPDLLVLMMCLRILQIAQSATSLSCFILGTAVFFAMRLRSIKANLGRLEWVLGGVVLVMFVFTVNAHFRELVTGILGRSETLTERTEIWEKALNLGTNPLIGSGFSSVWLSPKGAALVFEWGGLAHSHNGYIETYLNSGWIGVCLLLAVLVSAGRNATSQLSRGSKVGYLFMALFLAGLFYNYSEVAFNRSNVMGMLLWLMAVPLWLPTDSEDSREHDVTGDLQMVGFESTGFLEVEEGFVNPEMTAGTRSRPGDGVPEGSHTHI